MKHLFHDQQLSGVRKEEMTDSMASVVPASHVPVTHVASRISWFRQYFSGEIPTVCLRSFTTFDMVFNFLIK